MGFLNTGKTKVGGGGEESGSKKGILMILGIMKRR